MEYTTLEGIEPKLSRLVYGTTAAACESPEKAFDQLENAYRYGFRVFDTANSYDRSEESLGYWLERSGHRSEIALFDKGFNPNQHYGAPVDLYSADTIREQLALSLQRMHTDYVDFYVLHRDDPGHPVDEIIDVLNEQKALGRIRRFGVSNWTFGRIKEANDYAKAHGLEGFSVVGPCYSLANCARDPAGGSVTLSGPQNKAFRAWIAKENIPVFPYSALARGFMSGAYKTTDLRPIEQFLSFTTRMEYNTPDNIAALKRAEKLAAEHGCGVSTIAMAWLLSRPLNIFPITTPTGDKHLQDAVNALTLKLTKEELDYLRNEEAEEV